jgi:hypothetical protein
LIDLPKAAELLGLSKRTAQAYLKRGWFPPVTDQEDGDARWDPGVVWTHAVTHGMTDRAAAMPLEYWPTHDTPATYAGGRVAPGCVVQDWHVQGVPLRVYWPLPDERESDPREVAALHPRVPQVIKVGYGYGIWGPELWAFNAEGGDAYKSTPGWNDYAATIGGMAPFWAHGMRIPELIARWKPGAEQVLAPAVPDLNSTPLLRLAAILSEGSLGQRVLLNLAATVQWRATSGVRHQIAMLLDDVRCDTAIIAATPMDTPEADTDDLDEPTRRAGWLEILGRHDTLAVAAVQEYKKWDGGSSLPFSKVEEIDTSTQWGTEWAQRLVPLEHRTAAFEVVDYNGSGGELHSDPETDAPVIRTRSGELYAAIPQALPAGSPLSEVVLDGPIWVRVQDGTLYMAPRHSYFGMAWGYGGSGPGTLALMLHRLLADINARAADSINGAPDTLERFTQVEHPHGSVFTREQLEAVRDGLPYQ